MSGTSPEPADALGRRARVDTGLREVGESSWEIRNGKVGPSRVSSVRQAPFENVKLQFQTIQVVKMVNKSLNSCQNVCSSSRFMFRNFCQEWNEHFL